MHVGGFTRRHPDVPPALRGTFAGLATPQVIDHLKSLGVTTIELLPVHAFVDDRPLVRARALPTTGATTPSASSPPTPRYGAPRRGERVQDHGEDACTRPGIEVILDVVYNHTGEGNERGPDARRSAASTTAPTTGSAEDRRH